MMRRWNGSQSQLSDFKDDQRCFLSFAWPSYDEWASDEAAYLTELIRHLSERTGILRSLAPSATHTHRPVA